MRAGDVPVLNIAPPVKIVRVVSTVPKKEEPAVFVRLLQKRKLFQKTLKVEKNQKKQENLSLNKVNKTFLII